MSKKILEEGTIRQFMKLANIEALSGGFVDKLNENEEVEELEEEVEELEEKAEELEEEVEELDEMGMAYDAHEGDEDDLGDLDAEEPADEAGEVSLSPEEAELLKGVLEKLLGAMDEEEAAAEEEPAMEEPEMDLDEPADAEMPLEEEVEELEEEVEEVDEVQGPCDAGFEYKDGKCAKISMPHRGHGDSMPKGPKGSIKSLKDKGPKKEGRMEEALVNRIAAKVAARLLDAKK